MAQIPTVTEALSHHHATVSLEPPWTAAHVPAATSIAGRRAITNRRTTRHHPPNMVLLAMLVLVLVLVLVVVLVVILIMVATVVVLVLVMVMPLEAVCAVLNGPFIKRN